MPPSIVVRLIEVIEFNVRHSGDRYSDLDPALGDREREEPVGAWKGVIDEEAVFFICPELEADIEGFGPLLSEAKLDKGLIVLEGDGQSGVIDEATSDNATNNLCKITFEKC